MKLFLAIFFLIGAYLIAISLYASVQYIGASDWHSVNGIVEKSAYNISGAKASTSTASIQYSYQVNGQNYVNNRIRFGIQVASHAPVTEYRKGGLVAVFYNPDSPNESVLNRKDTQAIIFGFIVGLVFISFYFVGLWFEKRKA